MEKLSLFFAKIRELSFWQRLFSWRFLRNLSYDAFEEFRALQKEMQKGKDDLVRADKELTQVTAQNETVKRTLAQMDSSISRKDEKIAELNKFVSDHKAIKEQQEQAYNKKVAELNQLKETLDSEIKRLNDQRVEEQQRNFEKMKLQWSAHESAVEQKLKIICQTHLVQYLDEVPFKGSPDNTIEICDEYIIFDAKSPSNDDLTNFPKYIKAQTENVKKYANQEKVKKDIFLVVPTNTIEAIGQLTYRMGDYDVYVITIDALEPIILSLKKIEQYEFVKQLSPEERDNICRVIGKFAHTTKRKIQIDQFFAAEFLEILVRCKNDLPAEILNQVIEYEKAERLNPPSEQKSKQILTKELQDKHALINAEAGIRDVIIPSNFDDIKKMG